MSFDYAHLREWLDMVDRANPQAGDTIEFTYPGSTVEIVRELLRLHDGVERYRDAGLLAPELPEPQEHGGKLVWPITELDGWAVSLHDGWIRIADKYGAAMDVDTELAHGFARALLAATKHAGEQQETKGDEE